jgi:hypothetical protein
MGGSGWIRANNRRLESQDRFERLAAIRAAWKRADDETRVLLRGISETTWEWDEGPIEQTKAAEALAVLGESQAVVEAVIRDGKQTSAYLDGLITAPRPFSDSVVQPAVDEIKSQAGAVLALGLAHRSDFIDDILDVFNDSPPDSDEALACVYAFRYLRDDRHAVLEALGKHLRLADSGWAAQRALLRIGTETALEVLASDDRTDAEVAISILSISPKQRTALNILSQALVDLDDRNVQSLLANAIESLDSELIGQLLRLPNVAESLRRQALAPEGSFWIRGAKVVACRGLAQLDRETAFLAAAKALDDPSAHDRARYPYLLASLDPDRALEKMLETASVEQPESLLMAIGRAFAALPEAGRAVVDMLESQNSLVRTNACRIAAKCAPNTNLEIALTEALDDPIPAVSDAAVEALSEFFASDHLACLAERLIGEPSLERKWLLLEILLRHGDPGDESAPLLPWQVPLTELPYPLWHHARNEIERRRREIASKAR